MARKIRSTFEKPVRVEVVWLDSQEEPEATWEDPEDLAEREPGNMECRTLAYLLIDGPDRLVLSHSLSASGQVSRTFDIPKVSVVAVRKVK